MPEYFHHMCTYENTQYSHIQQYTSDKYTVYIFHIYIYICRFCWHILTPTFTWMLYPRDIVHHRAVHLCKASSRFSAKLKIIKLRQSLALPEAPPVARNGAMLGKHQLMSKHLIGMAIFGVKSDMNSWYINIFICIHNLFIPDHRQIYAWYIHHLSWRSDGFFRAHGNKKIHTAVVMIITRSD